MDAINLNQSVVNVLFITLLACLFISFCCCCCIKICILGKLFQSIQTLTNTITNPLPYQFNQFLNELSRIQSNTGINNQQLAQEFIPDTKHLQTMTQTKLSPPIPHQTSSSTSNNSQAHIAPVRSSVGSITSPKSGQSVTGVIGIINR